MPMYDDYYVTYPDEHEQVRKSKKKHVKSRKSVSPVRSRSSSVETDRTDKSFESVKKKVPKTVWVPKKT
jgi:hypothetical protein